LAAATFPPSLAYRHGKAHSNSIIHRDINPDNILLSYENTLAKGLLSDFGLAQKVDNLEKIESAAGRYLYFAPECFSNIYLPTSDVFSSGIVFYKMLTGAAPWEIEIDRYQDTNDIINAIMLGRKITPTRPSFFNSEISDKLDQIILKSLALDIEERYKNSGEYLREINDIN